jgi:DNA invertase Pin-like site-specific DNA recombinase
MKLSKPTSTNSEDHMEQVKSNQSEGAKYVANMKRQGTKILIDEAISYLNKNKIPVSAIEIVNITGLSRATVYRYKDLIGKENVRAYTKFNDDILCEGPNDINKSLE